MFPVGGCSEVCVHCVHVAVYHMKETGWEKVSSTNVLDLHYQYAEEKKTQPDPVPTPRAQPIMADSGQPS